jgi:transposase InsO family protein
MISERYFRRQAVEINEVWSYGFLFDQTLDGRTLKVLMVVDEYTGECLVMRAGGSMKAADVFEALANAARERGMPRHLRCDDVLAVIARKVKDWLQEVEAVTLHVEPGDPTENAPSDSFNGWLRDQLGGGPLFGSLEEAVVLLERWRRAHNEERRAVRWATAPRQCSFV